jgi:hypothetical protein
MHATACLPPERNDPFRPRIPRSLWRSCIGRAISRACESIRFLANFSHSLTHTQQYQIYIIINQSLTVLRARLKIEFRKECWFDSGQGHHASRLRLAEPSSLCRSETAKLARRSPKGEDGRFPDLVFKQRTRLCILAAYLPELFMSHVPQKVEGAGKAGCWDSTRSLACEIKQAHERSHHRYAEAIRPSLREWF